MGELREIVTVEQMNRLFVFLASVLPFLGLLLGTLLGRRSGNMRRGMLLGLAIGAAGPLNWLMWQVFNALTERNGLDTVRNVFVNLAVFVVVGLFIGVVIGRVLRSHLPAAPEETNNAEQIAPTS